ncbi:MAG: PspA/IM30 family protein [Planctomycetota bacterium]
MGLFSRLGRIISGKANETVDTLEDASFESTLKQTIREQKEALNKTITASAQAIANFNQLKSDSDKAQRQAEEWEQKAMQALQSGREDLAKKCLSKKTECTQQIESLASPITAAEAATEKLKRQIAEMKTKIEEADRNSATLIARRNAAKAQKQVAEALSVGSISDNAFSTLKRFEESVSKQEAEASAYLEMSGSSDNNLDKELAALQSSSVVEDDLKALKAKMGKS